MNILELGALGEFVGSIGVIVTLIYLALQLRRSTVVMRNAAVHAIATSGRDLSSIAMSSPFVAQVMEKIASSEKLTPLEETQRNLIAQASFRAAESNYLHWKTQMISETFWNSRRESLKMLISMARPEWWESVKRTYEPTFVVLVDDLWREASA